jgi:hypothetical protein
LKHPHLRNLPRLSDGSDPSTLYKVTTDYSPVEDHEFPSHSFYCSFNTRSPSHLVILYLGPTPLLSFSELTMPIFSSLIAASTLASLALANPIPQVAAPRKGFTVNQAIPKPFQSGPLQLQKAFNKYAAPVPADVAAAAAGQGSVVATPEQFDAEYLCPVTIGGQTLNLDFDTGSADL